MEHERVEDIAELIEEGDIKLIKQMMLEVATELELEDELIYWFSNTMDAVLGIEMSEATRYQIAIWLYGLVYRELIKRMKSDLEELDNILSKTLKDNVN